MENVRIKRAQADHRRGGRKGTSRSSGGQVSTIWLEGYKKKKSSPAQLEATQCSRAKATLVGDRWEIIPAASQKFSVPAMPKVSVPAVEEHRAKLRELVREKIKELEFKVALELFASVARLVKPPLTKSGKTSEIRVFGMRSASGNAAT